MDAMFDKAVDVAIKNAKDYRFRLATVIYKRGTILSLGWNKKKTHPLQSKYATNEQRIYLHAEIDALIKCKFSAPGATLLVVRLLKSGKLGNSCPCNGCWAALQEAEVRKVIYWDGELKLHKFY